MVALARLHVMLCSVGLLPGVGGQIWFGGGRNGLFLPREGGLFMLERISGGALVALIAGAVTLSAQERVPPQHVPLADHAAIGTLATLDEAASTLTITTLDEAEATYQFDDETAVRGLMKCKDVLTLRGKEGESVVVHFAEEEGLPLALSVEYLGKAPIYQVLGLVKQIDGRNRMLVLENEAGKRLQFDVGRRAPIDSPKGIMPLAMFADKVGQRVTVYYTPVADANLAVLVQVGKAPTT
jgi:hypothetical protein